MNTAVDNWSLESVDPLDGKLVVITGANSGLGFESARALASKGAQIVMASRNLYKAEQARSAIVSGSPAAKIDILQLDVGNRESVASFADSFLEKYDRLDVLMNNAGIMAIPEQRTAEGFELQFATNHLGHFALTGRLLDVLTATPASRLVVVTSLAADLGKIRFDDLMWEKKYGRWFAYFQSKLANMLFGIELDRRLKQAGRDTVCVLAHPGYSSTNLQSGPSQGGGVMGSVTEKVLRMLCQTQTQGALPQICAATCPGLTGGEYVGPNGFQQMKGKPELVKFPRSARRPGVAEQLWQRSEELTGVSYLST